MEIVILKGKTRHGKNRIREHGDRWLVERDSGSVAALDGAPGLHLMAMDCECPTCEKDGPALRWVCRNGNDPDFEVKFATRNGFDILPHG